MPIPKPIRSNSAVLHVLRKAAPKLRRSILKTADPKIIKLLSECSLNVLRGNVKVSSCTKKKLQKYKKALRTLAGPASIPTKRRVLVQNGGFLPVLLGTILSGLLGTFLSR